MPRVFISATRKSSGKTTISAGLCGALKKRGLQVQPFKKGPDYIDPMWLRKFSGNCCYNLDFNTQSTEEINALCASKLSAADFGLIEGNKGLYDGVDLYGADSNAAMAKLLQTPVILVIDAEGSTRGVVPLINGYIGFDADIQIGGVILNNIGGQRHESKLRAVIEHYTDISVLGAVQRSPELVICERHLGLVTDREDKALVSHMKNITDAVEKQVDVDAVIDIGRQAGSLNFSPSIVKPPEAATVRLGVALDNAFCFYYADDLEALRANGAELVFFNTLSDQKLPQVDALFIGGGFPETHARELEQNSAMRNEIKKFAGSGKPVYAECGGLMYLSEAISWNETRHEMAGVIPGTTVMSDKPVGRGYIKLSLTSSYPWPAGNDSNVDATLNAHEFHYSRLVDLDDSADFAFDVKRGYGIDGERDGLVFANVFATYAHMRNTASNPWASRFVAAIKDFQSHQGSS